ncbi:metallophosphoesterase [Magnetococcus sp. PR-3]|uniref:metallophosphoesterase n=1 Tax=Magnetococcus sp. PR-3 TaxID=3120355 RepID=UPI002FCE2FF5
MRFVLIILTCLTLINFYSYRRFFCKVGPRAQRFGFVVFFTLTLGEMLYFGDRFLDLLPTSKLLTQGLSSFVGISFMLFIVAILYDVLQTTAHRIPFSHHRRNSLKRLLDFAMLIGASSYLLQGFWQGSTAPKVKKVQVHIPDFPVQNYTIVQLTDVHIGRTIKRDFIEDLVNRTNALKPNLVVITGDLVDQHPSVITQDLAPLKNIQAPTYFVTGNHEYFHRVNDVLDHLQTLDIVPLNNHNSLQKEGFYLVGISDLFGKRWNLHPPNLPQAYHGVDTSKPVIVLAHQPKAIEEFSHQRCDLMLSGHTHGGQIFPFGMLVKLAQPYLAGLHTHKPGQQIYVSRGTGYWGPPLRVLAPSEITHITIKT